MQFEAVQYLAENISGLLGIYLFGSRNTSNFNASSDLDLAVLSHFSHVPANRKLSEHQLELSLLLDLPVDLVDLREVPLDFKYIILHGGRRIYCTDEVECDWFEMTTYSMYQRFEIERREIVQEVKNRGFIHGR